MAKNLRPEETIINNKKRNKLLQKNSFKLFISDKSPLLFFEFLGFFFIMMWACLFCAIIVYGPADSTVVPIIPSALLIAGIFSMLLYQFWIYASYTEYKSEIDNSDYQLLLCYAKKFQELDLISKEILKTDGHVTKGKFNHLADIYLFLKHANKQRKYEQKKESMKTAILNQE